MWVSFSNFLATESVFAWMQSHIAIEIFKNMISRSLPRDAATYNIMIDCCSTIKCYKSACALVSMMMRDGFLPWTLTYTALIKVLFLTLIISVDFVSIPWNWCKHVSYMFLWHEELFYFYRLIVVVLETSKLQLHTWKSHHSINNLHGFLNIQFYSNTLIHAKLKQRLTRELGPWAGNEQREVLVSISCLVCLKFQPLFFYKTTLSGIIIRLL